MNSQMHNISDKCNTIILSIKWGQSEYDLKFYADTLFCKSCHLNRLQVVKRAYVKKCILWALWDVTSMVESHHNRKKFMNPIEKLLPDSLMFKAVCNVLLLCLLITYNFWIKFVACTRGCYLFLKNVQQRVIIFISMN